MLLRLCLASLLLLSAPAFTAQYLTQQQFLQQAFSSDDVDTGVVWLTADVKLQLKQELSMELSTLRQRYWHSDGMTAWILDEIGKERPITIGVVVVGGVVQFVRVLEFRESRGWEIRYPAFTEQFEGAQIQEGRLNQQVDNVTGATLSVRAMKKVVRLALFFDQYAKK